MNNKDCIFCRICAGELPSSKIYETDNVFAFLDISPIDKGHTLVIPKAHYADLFETPDAVVAETMEAVRLIARGMIAAGFDGVNILQSNLQAAGQVVPHLHFHVIPRMLSPEGPKWISGAAPYADAAEREAFAARIRNSVAKMKGDAV